MDLNPLKKMPYSFIIFLKCKHYLWEENIKLHQNTPIACVLVKMPDSQNGD